VFKKSEEKTLILMIKLYCKRHHGKSLCENCSDLLTYSKARLKACPFKEKKPTCSNCKIHCYENLKREQIKKVMREIGPKLIFIRPDLALIHFMKRFV